MAKVSNDSSKRFHRFTTGIIIIIAVAGFFGFVLLTWGSIGFPFLQKEAWVRLLIIAFKKWSVIMIGLVFFAVVEWLFSGSRQRMCKELEREIEKEEARERLLGQKAVIEREKREKREEKISMFIVIAFCLPMFILIFYLILSQFFEFLKETK